ncbi:MAG: 30S ribosomal protein S5 [bacterium]|nr:30S ribosomal protein S5 [bacterium]
MAKIEKAPQGAGAPGKGREGGREGGRDGREGGGRDRKGGGRDRDKKEGGDREGSELVERLVAINRVAKVVKGGRRFGFAALVVVGDGRGRIGAGAGKAREVPEAIKKATDQAKRRMIRVPLRDGRTIHHDIEARFGAGLVRLRTAEAGTGIIAGGPLRAVFEVLGIQDVVAKSIGSSNPYNMVKAALEAFKLMESPRMVAARRGRRVNEVLGRKGDAKEKSDE